MKVYREKPYLYKVFAGANTYKVYKASGENIWNIPNHSDIIKESEGNKIVRLKLSNEYLSVGGDFCGRQIEAFKEHRNMLLVKLK